MTVEVWWASPRTGLEHLLSAAERARATRLRHAADRLGFVTGRALARAVLAARTGVAPGDLQLAAVCRTCGGAHGKPRLTGPAGIEPVPFNLAHTAGLVVLAVGPDTQAEVGVDVEGDAPAARVAALALAGREHHALTLLPGRQRARMLATRWARTEAALKATGYGLAITPSSVVLRRSTAVIGGITVTLRDLTLPLGYVGTVAVVGAARFAVIERPAGGLLRRSAA